MLLLFQVTNIKQQLIRLVTILDMVPEQILLPHRPHQLIKPPQILPIMQILHIRPYIILPIPTITRITIKPQQILQRQTPILIQIILFQQCHYTRISTMWGAVCYPTNVVYYLLLSHFVIYWVFIEDLFYYLCE